MNLRRSAVLLMTLALLVTLACGAQSTLPAPDLNQLNTAIAQTAAAAVTQSLIPFTASLSFSATPSATPSPAPPTVTFTPSSTATPTDTATPSVPVISVSTPTNCRSGPGKVYDYRSALLVGQVAQVLARDSTGEYWYIPSPDKPGEFCWVWGKYALIAGDISKLPVYTPPPTPSITSTPSATPVPTPAPDFTLTYSGKDSCAANWWVEFVFLNNGDLNLRSLQITVFDSDTHTTVKSTPTGFTDSNGCAVSNTVDSLGASVSTTVSAPPFAYDMTGHEIELTVKACSKPGMSGQCVKRKIEFVP